MDFTLDLKNKSLVEKTLKELNYAPDNAFLDTIFSEMKKGDVLVFKDKICYLVPNMQAPKHLPVIFPQQKGYMVMTKDGPSLSFEQNLFGVMLSPEEQQEYMQTLTTAIAATVELEMRFTRQGIKPSESHFSGYEFVKNQEMFAQKTIVELTRLIADGEHKLRELDKHYSLDADFTQKFRDFVHGYLRNPILGRTNIEKYLAPYEMNHINKESINIGLKSLSPEALTVDNEIVDKNNVGMRR